MPKLAILDVHGGRNLKELENSSVIEVAITGNVGSGVYLVSNGTGKQRCLQFVGGFGWGLRRVRAHIFASDIGILCQLQGTLGRVIPKIITD